MKRERIYRLAYVVADSVAASAAYLLFNCLRYTIEDTGHYWGELADYLFNAKATNIGVLLWLYWLALIWLTGYYNRPLNKGRIDDIITTAGTVLVGGTIQYLLLVTNDIVHDPSLLLPLYGTLVLCYFVCFYAARSVITTHCRLMRDDVRFHPRALIIGIPQEIERLRLKEREMRFRTCGTVELREDLAALEQEVAAMVRSEAPNVLFVASGHRYGTLPIRLLYSLYRYDAPVYVTLESLALSPLSYAPKSSLAEPLVDVMATRMSEMEKNIKWLCDKVLSLVSLVLLVPLFVAIGIAVRRSSSGKIFYTQERIGRKGKPFRIIKFRTMFDGSEADGPQLSSDHDERITPIGRFLRRYRLDELPQFYNVLKGDMSLVGPRPERAYYIDKLLDKAPYCYLLHNVRPGITSWGMVRYGYASNTEQMLDRLQYDWLYYQNMSLRLDLEIMLYTIGVLFKGKGK